MNRTPLFVALVTLATIACGGESEEGGMEIPPELASRAEVTLEHAQATALASAPGSRLLHAELEEEDGALIYSFDLRLEGETGVKEVHVDAHNGRIVSTEYESVEQEADEAKGNH